MKILADELKTLTGGRSFCMSASPAELNMFDAGNHFFYNVTDLKSGAVHDAPAENDVVVLTDVIAHMNMSQLESLSGRVILSYGPRPTRAGGRTPNSSFHITSRGAYCETVDGGSEYVEPIFCPPTNFVLRYAWWKSGFCLYEEIVLPLGDANRCVGILVPRAQCRLPYSIYKCLGASAGMDVNSVPLLSKFPGAHVEAVNGEMYTVIVRQTKGIVYWSIATPYHGTHEVTIPFTELSTLQRCVKANPKTSMSILDSAWRRMRGGATVALEDSTLLAGFLKVDKLAHIDPVCYVPFGDGIPKTLAKLTAPPLVRPATIVGQTATTARDTLQKRVIDKRTPGFEIDGEVKAFCREFSEKFADFLTEDHKLTPLSKEDAIERLASNPIRTRRIEQACALPDPQEPETVKIFMKKETIDGAAESNKAGRAIFPVGQNALIEGSMFTYPLLDAFKKRLPNYLSGKSYEDCEEIVGKFIDDMTADDLFETDFSGFDASTNRTLIAEWEHFVDRCFGDTFKDMTSVMYRTSQDLHGRMMCGTTRLGIDLDDMVLSGSACTHLKGTFIHLMKNYVTARLVCKTVDKAHNPKNAYSRKIIDAVSTSFDYVVDGCMAYGDDGLCKDYMRDKEVVVRVRHEEHVEAAKRMGLTLTMEVSPSELRGYGNVSYSRFLSRAWTSDGQSVALTHRALAGLCVTTQTDGRVGLECKIYATLQREPENSLLYAYANAVSRVEGLKRPDLSKITDRETLFRLTASEEYECAGGNRQMAEVERIESNELGISVITWGETVEALHAAKTLDDIAKCRLEGPVIGADLPVQAYSVDDEGVLPMPEVATIRASEWTPTVTESVPPARTRRTKTRAGAQNPRRTDASPGADSQGEGTPTVASSANGTNVTEQLQAAVNELDARFAVLQQAKKWDDDGLYVQSYEGVVEGLDDAQAALADALKKLRRRKRRAAQKAKKNRDGGVGGAHAVRRGATAGQ